MRIEAYTQVQQLYSNSKVVKNQGTASSVSRKDEVQLSSMGIGLQTAKAAVKASPDIRYDVVEPLKKAIQDGTYDVSGESFADKLLAKYAEMR